LREEAVKAKRRGRKCKKVQEVERRREQSSGGVQEKQKKQKQAQGGIRYCASFFHMCSVEASYEVEMG
jgi:hypothetical protein